MNSSFKYNIPLVLFKYYVFRIYGNKTFMLNDMWFYERYPELFPEEITLGFMNIIKK